MSWQSLAEVMDNATSREADDAARYAPIRTAARLKPDTLLCPACDRRIPAEALHTHFEALHEDRPLNCPHPRCDFVGHNALSLAGHKRYRHREAV